MNIATIRPALLSACFLMAVRTAHAQSTHVVPGDWADVQAAVAGAASGDTILVGPGTWPGPIDFLGKEVRVASISGPAATIIDGANAATCVVFRNYEGPGAALEGFTIRNGLSSIDLPGGGGVYCYNALPTIRNCVIRDNRARNGDFASTGIGRHGGGAFVLGGAPRFESCVFEANRAGNGVSWLHPEDPSGDEYGGYGGRGGGAFVAAGNGVRFIDCVFRANRAGDAGSGEYGDAGGHGGGLFGSGPAWFVEDCVFDGNVAGNQGSSYLGSGGGGGAGGAAAVAGGLLMRHCLIVGNRGGTGGSSDAYGGVGGLRLFGGVELRDSTVVGNIGGGGGPNHGTGGVFAKGAVLIVGCDIRGNAVAPPPAFGWGAHAAGSPGGVRGVAESGIAPTIVSTRIVGNFGGAAAAGYAGGAGGFDGVADLQSCTIAQNVGGFGSAADGVGGLLVKGPTSLQGCVVWGNSSGAVVVAAGAPAPATTYSCVEGGMIGVGNIAIDPGFVAAGAGDFRLTATSPCVDAGPPTFGQIVDGPTAFDAEGMPRFIDGDLNGAVRVDIGAHEFNHGRLTMTKTYPPNGSTLLTIGVEGTAGLFAALAAGANCDLWLPPYGPLLLEPSTLVVVPLGTLPVAIPPYLILGGSNPWTLHVQAFVFGGLTGNLTNRLKVVVP